MKQNANEILTVRALSKNFPGVRALSNVDLTLNKGEILALMGENGAGKSTLIKCITGVHPRDEGEILFDGKSINCTSPLHAQAIGISPVYQEVNLVPNLSVAENLFLGRYPTKPGRIDWGRISIESREILKRFDLTIDVDRNLGEYPVAIQQMIAIARALELKSKVLILDEPTSSLNVQETARLFTQMRRLKEDGHAIIFVTHFLDQVYEVCDTITVLRNGGYVGTYPVEELSKVQLIAKLLGKEMEKLGEVNSKRLRPASDQSETGASVLCARDFGQTNGVKPFSLSVEKGEVVGCAGLLGSGRTEIANLFFGIDSADKGSLEVNGQKVNINNPRAALKYGIALSPEDRKAQGIIGDLTIRENIILALQNRQGWGKPIPFAKQTEIAEKFIDLLRIKTPAPEQAIKKAWYGNQQKVIIARWLAADPQFLIFDEPTRGIDVGAKTEIQKLVIELSQKGLAVMFISTEIEEVARCSTKVIIMHDKEVTKVLAGDEIKEEIIMHSIAEGHA